jgi:YidC/Oxa1 family membrane protein insertase
MDQKRFLLAILLSAAILFSWQYFFAPIPEQPNLPESKSENIKPTADQAQPVQSQQPVVPLQGEAVDVPVSENTPQRTIVVDTPLYRATFDSRGAVPVSWIVKKNKDKDGEREIFSVGADISERQPLELISRRGLEMSPREVPLRLLTGDKNLDEVLNERNYKISEDLADNADVITLQAGTQRRISFELRDQSSGLIATKTFDFAADDYSVGVNANAARNGSTLPSLELSIGPNTGDQGIRHYTFYSVAPEAVVGLGDGAERHTAQSVNDASNNPGNLLVKQPIQWASIADTYFAMVAIPSQPSPQARFLTQKYEHEDQGQKEDRFLINGFIPIAAEGLSVTLYVGPKDHFVLENVSEKLTKSFSSRTIDLDGLIDYGYFSQVSRPLAIPILKAIKWIHSFTGNYGVAIIIFTIIIYSLFFPLKWRSSKAMKKAQKFAPRMKEVQEKIKSLKSNDPRLKELQTEQLRLMKEGNMLGGCLPLLIQMPFFFALYRAITISLDFRQATFLWLPDLSAGDPIHLLPVLMAASVLVVQLVTPAPTADPMQRKMMAFIMPGIMLYALWSAPAGLLLYWLAGNIIIFGQQMLINKLIQTPDDQEPPQPLISKQPVAVNG